MQHALTALRAELAVLRDCRRRLIYDPPADMTGAQRQALLDATNREIREVELGLAHLVVIARRDGRAAA